MNGETVRLTLILIENRNCVCAETDTRVTSKDLTVISHKMASSSVAQKQNIKAFMVFRPKMIVRIKFKGQKISDRIFQN
jgi:hypothetical protein